MLTNILIKMNSPILKPKHFDVFLVFSYDLCLCCLSSFLCLSIHNYCDSWFSPRRWHPSLSITRRLHCNNLTYIGSRNDVCILWFKRYEMTKWLKQIGICENSVFLLLLLILYLIFIRKNPPGKWVLGIKFCVISRWCIDLK
jgi:hypothetical protein